MKSSFAFDVVLVLAGQPTTRRAIILGAVVGFYWIGIDTIDFWQNHIAPWLWPIEEIPI